MKHIVVGPDMIEAKKYVRTRGWERSDCYLVTAQGKAILTHLRGRGYGTLDLHILPGAKLSDKAYQYLWRLAHLVDRPIEECIGRCEK